MKKFAEGRFTNPKDKRDDYSELTNNCIDFTKDIGKAGGVDTPMSIFPKGAIERYQDKNTGFNYDFKKGTLNGTRK